MITLAPMMHDGCLRKQSLLYPTGLVIFTSKDEGLVIKLSRSLKIGFNFKLIKL